MEAKIKQKIVRVYPHGWTGNSVKDLQDLFNQGWIVKHITPCNHDKGGGIINDYILEKYDLESLQ